MADIKKIFLTQTIADFMDPQCDMPYIKFVFDKETLVDFINHLDPKDVYTYQYGLESIKYLLDTYKWWYQTGR